jgi:hypothetical protein
MPGPRSPWIRPLWRACPHGLSKKLSVESRQDAFYGQVILADALSPTGVVPSLMPGSSVSTGLVTLITPLCRHLAPSTPTRRSPVTSERAMSEHSFTTNHSLALACPELGRGRSTSWSLSSRSLSTGSLAPVCPRCCGLCCPSGYTRRWRRWWCRGGGWPWLTCCGWWGLRPCP